MEKNDRPLAKVGIPLFLAGAAIGAVLGLLFAPASGKEVRESIANKVDALKEQVKRLQDKITKRGE